MPSQKLTHQGIKSIKNPPPYEKGVKGTGTVDYFDTVCTGLAFRASYNGGRSWIVRYRSPVDLNERGEKKIRTITIGKYPSMGLADATDAYDGIIKQVRHNNDPQKEKRDAREASRDNALKIGPDPVTVKDAASLYIEEHVKGVDEDGHPNCKAKVKADGSLYYEREWIFEKYIYPSIGSKRLDEFKPKDWKACQRRIKQAHGPVMAQRAIEALRAAFNWLHDEDVIEAVPIIRIKRKTKQRGMKGRIRYLNYDEIQDLWRDLSTAHQANKSNHFASITKLLLLTGQRREEVARMCWSELDLDGLKWNLPPERTKNGYPHSVPLTDTALEIIKSQDRKENCDFVFTSDGKRPFTGFSRSKERLDKRLEFSEHWILHDLRRTFVTHVSGLGIPPHVVEACVNHVSGAAKSGVAGIYNQADYWPERVAAMTLWADTVAAIVSGEVKSNVVPLRAGASDG